MMIPAAGEVRPAPADCHAAQLDSANWAPSLWLNAGYRSRGWNPPGTTTRTVTGHSFGLTLERDDKAALLAFLRSF
jgi:hypothetical protein